VVWVCTGSFRGVRDQPVTDHEGLIPADVRHIRRVFAPYSPRIRHSCVNGSCARSVTFPSSWPGLLIAARACGLRRCGSGEVADEARVKGGLGEPVA
jgi:hypothetical protein